MRIIKVTSPPLVTPAPKGEVAEKIAETPLLTITKGKKTITPLIAGEWTGKDVAGRFGCFGSATAVVLEASDDAKCE